MLEPNAAARAYEYVARFRTTKTDTGDVPDEQHSGGGKATLTYGNAFQAGTHGIQVYLLETDGFDTDPTPQDFNVDLITPIGTYNYSDSTWRDDVYSKLEFDNLVLTVNPDCSWSLTFDELRWYLDFGSGYVLQETIAAQSWSGIDFDHRYNVYDLMPLAGLAIADDSATACEVTVGATYADEQEYENKTEARIDGSWRWDEGSGWNYDPVDRWVWTIPAITNCEHCDAITLPAVGAGALSDTLYAEAIQGRKRTKAIDGTIDCACIEDPGITWTVTSWHVKEEHIHRESQLTAASETAPMRQHLLEGYSECGIGTRDEDEQTVTLDHCYVSLYRWSRYKECRKTQTEGIPQPCPPPAEPGPDYECTNPYFLEYSCFSELYERISWPIASPCEGATECCPYVLCLPDGSYHRTSVVEGDIWYRAADFISPLPWRTTAQVTNTGDCSHGKMSIDPSTQRITILYVRDGLGVYERFSDDNGASWSAESFVVAGFYPDIKHGQDGAQLMLWFVYDSGTSGPGTIQGKFREPGDTAWSAVFTIKDEAGVNISVADGGFGFDKGYSGDDRWSISFTEDGDSAPSDWASFDGEGRTWMRIA